ncbi:MAG: type II toxin-antitoxin system HicB family antitoxin [Muribaculaceae bacterium]|nr:type II toxin-antitoxin system HicB family antitoxin [Muribaculaceae bacterium]
MGEQMIKVDVTWTDDNFGCAWSDDVAGTVVVTAKTLDKLKSDFEESLRLHIEGCLEDGDELPEYLVNGDYEIEYVLNTAALLRDAEEYTTMAALSRASGINQKQLSHYASGIKNPRPVQVERIKAGLKRIGTQLLALS